MNFYFYLNRMIYNLSYDKNVSHIEEILHCSVVNGKGKYYGKYVSYLLYGSASIDKLRQLEYVLKKHIEIIVKDYNFILKVYHYSLPTYIEYEAHESKDLILGIGYNGLVKISMNTEVNNYLICGCSGSGKSTLAISIIKNLIDNDVEVIICDNKESFDYNGLKAPLHKGVESCLYQLNKFEAIINKRMKVNKHHAPLLLIIDEVFPFLTLDSKERKRVMNQLALIMSKSRSVNCHICIITQRCTTDIIDAKLLANISNRICLATSSKQESLNVLNTDIAFDIDIKGRGYLSINGHLQEFQSYYYKPPKISQNEAIADVAESVKIESEVPSQDEVIYFD